MSHGSSSTVDPAIADLAHSLTVALEKRRSHVWRGHAAADVAVVSASRLRIVPVTTLSGLTEVVSTLLSSLRESRGGSGVILLPDDVPMSCVADLVEPFVDYGVTIETTPDVRAKAKSLKDRAESRRERVRARWRAQRTQGEHREVRLEK